MPVLKHGGRRTDVTGRSKPETGVVSASNTSAVVRQRPRPTFQVQTEGGWRVCRRSRLNQTQGLHEVRGPCRTGSSHEPSFLRKARLTAIYRFLEGYALIYETYEILQDLSSATNCVRTLTLVKHTVFVREAGSGDRPPGFQSPLCSSLVVCPQANLPSFSVPRFLVCKRVIIVEPISEFLTNEMPHVCLTGRFPPRACGGILFPHLVSSMKLARPSAVGRSHRCLF